MSETKRVLVVGAGGFTGGYMVDEGLRRGYEVWAGVRESTSRKYLTDPRIKFAVFDFDDPETLKTTMESALPEGERWDYIVYNLGATKVTCYADFSRINYDYLRRFTTALKEGDKMPEKFLYISSLAVLGPRDERGYTPFREDMIPTPNTRYGASKLKAEMWLEMENMPYVTLRFTGIYGPRDHDYFLMFKSVKSGFDFSAGFRKQLLTFIYVEDAARAVYDALERAPIKETYHISEKRGYTQREFRRVSRRAVGKRFVFPVKVPIWILKVVSVCAEKYGVAMQKPSTLNSDKYKLMRQRNFAVDTSKAERDFGFAPQVGLAEGVERAVKWYKEEGWL